MPAKSKFGTEYAEQVILVNWFRRQYPNELLFAIPNGGSRHPYEAANLKRAGVTAGIPDLMLACARNGYHGMFIEMKRVKGGKVSVTQIEIAIALQEKGYLTVVAEGADKAKMYVENYMESALT
jgi:hypothetical protein